MRPLLGCFVEAGARGDAAPLPAALEAAFASLETAQRRWSFQDPDSELSRLNRRPGERVDLHPHSLRLLRLGLALMRRSAGAFDCTVGGLLVQSGELPDHGGPAALPRGKAADLELGADWARLRRPLRLTLDGIAKGYAVDLALIAMRRAGAQAGWINAGGDLRVFGAMSLPLHRREDDGSMVALGQLRNAAAASSRVGSPDPSFPSRLIAPDGRTASPGIWTVLARSAWRADALAKIAATAPSTEREALVRALGGCLLQPGTALGMAA